MSRLLPKAEATWQRIKDAASLVGSSTSEEAMDEIAAAIIEQAFSELLAEPRHA